MGKLVIKFKPTHYADDSDICSLIAYIAGHGAKKEQTILFHNANGLSKNYKKAPTQMIKVQRYFNKSSKRRIYHMIVSFPCNYVYNERFIIETANSIAKKCFPYHQSFYAVHNATDNLHIHFAINAVNYKTGKKWHKSKDEFSELKKDILHIINHLHCQYKLPYCDYLYL